MANGHIQNLKAQLNEVKIVETLRTDKESEHWQTCIMYLRLSIEYRFPHLPPSLPAEDAAQEAALLIYRNFSTFRHDSKFTTWAASIAFCSTVDMLRKLKAKDKWEVQVNDYGGEMRDILDMIESGEDPETLFLDKEKIQELRTGFEEFLNKRRKVGRDREILRLMAQHYNYQEIARMLGIHHTVVSSVVYAFRAFWFNKHPR